PSRSLGMGLRCRARSAPVRLLRHRRRAARRVDRVSIRARLEQRGASAPRWAPRRAHAVSGTQAVAAYSAAIGVAELSGALGWVIPGAMLDAALVPILLGH